MRSLAFLLSFIQANAILWLWSIQELEVNSASISFFVWSFIWIIVLGPWPRRESGNEGA